MSSELQLGGFGQTSDRRGLAPRFTRSLHTMQDAATIDLARLSIESDHHEVRAVLRKRLTEDGMQDVTDVGHLAQQLAAGDQFIAALLVPIVQEYARQTGQDARNFGR